jgi:hypothetical protein
MKYFAIYMLFKCGIQNEYNSKISMVKQVQTHFLCCFTNVILDKAFLSHGYSSSNGYFVIKMITYTLYTDTYASNNRFNEVLIIVIQ